ncbi:SHOCT domain-containing protein [Microbacterium invictum]|uniref:Type II secretory pathway pseudopilin PulG n=1 Tax=Microbacterium invictum TaxID=515415 RepID=A0AA40VKK7_9MICO|nr:MULTISPECIES: SHOCT domain-containing protein [Microbacterium]MBB4138586.1 type II secretory pathway pseudopilin PulG [Microbacterium invictum]
MLRRMGRPGLLGMAARTAVVAGTATAVSGGVARHQQAKAEEQAQQQAWDAQQQQEAMDAAAARAVADTQPQGAPPSGAGAGMLEQLTQLGTLHSQGILSDEEFAAAKAKLLS